MRYPWRSAPQAPGRSMHYRPRSLPTAVVPVLVAVAVLGYVAGHSRSDNGAAEADRTAKSAHVLIEYPRGWHPVAGGAQIPGLALAHPQLIVARGAASSSGLIIGELPAGELGPLPRRFVSRLHRLPQTTVVDLVEGQAYRYAQFSGPELQEPLTIFVIPNPDGDATALACYAPSQASRYMAECEQAVSGVTVVDQSQIYELTPEPGYAARISAAIASLDRLRVSLKRELHPEITAERTEQLATQLSEGFASAGQSLLRLEPSAAAVRVQKALASAIQRAREGYVALAGAAAERSLSSYTAAKERITAAEADVDWALENFVLTGYAPTLQSPTGAQP
ncbi:MAG TPA: hypothetical protein VHT25_04785 [Solirubrobacteraceae bacterium]|jgi:hypothetical protein|nr:hypothetical protein [Solirubrobacteraceae bacterium]